MSERSRPLVIFIPLLLLGLVGLINVTQSSQFETYRTIHVIQLVVSGVCLGVSLVGLLMRLRRVR